MATKTQEKPRDIVVRVARIEIIKSHDPDMTPGDKCGGEDRYKGEKPADRARYEAEDQKRLEAWNRDEWHFIGIYVSAVVELDFGAYKMASAVKVRTPGLWGIESDSSEDYFHEVAAEEYDTLKMILGALGLTDVPAIKSAVWKDR